MTHVSAFMDANFKHFNARETLDAAKGWNRLLDEGGKMFLAMAGAMSTGEIGITLGEMIRKDKVHAVCCTAANLEEDLFNLFNNSEYRLVPEYRDLSPEAELKLRDQGFNRVTDTCIPESVMLQVEDYLIQLWKDAAGKGESRFPWEYFYELLGMEEVRKHFQIPPEHSWVLAARDRNIPIYTPGWEDCTMANKFVALIMQGKLPDHGCVKTGTQQMQHLAQWYLEQAAARTPVGFFQVGGGIAGDFPICVVPMLIQDFQKKDTPFWAYFAQISDSTTSYGSYSGAVPNEKITWFKLAADTPRYMINSDASIVAPLIFSYVLGR